jgi:hypothetical protein
MEKHTTTSRSESVDALPSPVREILREKTLVFTVTTGRSGTGLLASLLSRLPNTTALHEPDPSFISVMRTVQTRPKVAKEFLCEEKLPFIAKQNARVYVETSHLFCKGFLEPLLELGVRPALIFLRREPRDVARSMYRLNTIPGRTKKGRTYYLQPNDPDTLFVSDSDSLTDYQLCFWYCLEIERRQQLYQVLADRYDLAASILTFSELVGSHTVLSRIAKSVGIPQPGLLNRLKLRVRGIPKKNAKQDRKSDFDVGNPCEQETEVYRRMAFPPNFSQ